MAQVHGTCDPRFEQVRTQFQQFIDSGEEIGAAVTVNIDGEDVVDLWGGFTDKERTQPWDRDTIVTIFSMTKNILSLAMLILVDRGVLSITDKVSKFWPEFAANGKENVEIRHILSHTSGLSGWESDRPLTFDEICDLDAAAAKLAAQAPWWEPGTASGYHSWTFGHLLAAIVRRATGSTLQEFVIEEIVKPLGADFQFGVSEKDLPRTTDVIAVAMPPLGPGMGPQPGSITAKSMNPLPMPLDFGNGAAWRQGNILSGSGHSNARAVNRILSAISLGGSVDGKRLLSRETLDLIFEEQSNGVDLVIGAPLRFGVGFALTVDDGPAAYLSKGRVCFWGGLGGSLAVMDLDRKMTITYVMNKMSMAGLGNSAVKSYIKTIYEALDEA
ncbi:beta-lactamase domain-containing protein 2 [Colletotrichum spaethianum]|uniref:Beta-lactamase domain-containing protein 2 n=1 Tax=Colletotrichum spaethianum TaxID=700344 RepID=A0AA37L6S0_9PEZI|nr:beta-lactamase domain-containing protein 2 [Colletotrichum spaethianum]GKT42887.1 beta-lactamase domain-containing protein 2 [Colletotrichum spaethianum]